MSQGVPAPGEALGPPAGELRRVIGFWGGVALIIGITIGSGVFRKPYTLASEVHHPGVILALWAGFGLISICGALALAELSSMLPRTGGTYVFLREAYGDSAAFVFGWLYLLVTTPATVGALATYFAELILAMFGENVARDHALLLPVLASATVLGLSIANLTGARLGSAIQGLFTLLKVGALLLLMGVSFFWLSGSFRHLLPSGARAENLGSGAASVIWAYDGWIAVSMIAGEVVAPEKRMKQIIIFGMLAIVGLYLGANLGYFYVLPSEAMALEPRGVPQRIMTLAMGPGGAILISALILASVFGALNGNVLAKPRVSFALARDGLTFGFLGRAHPRWSTPYAAILIQAAGAVVLVFLLREPKSPQHLFDKLTTYFVVVEWFALLFAVGAVFVLRKKRPDVPRPFRTPLYPWVPLVFIVGTVLGLGAIVRDKVLQTKLVDGKILPDPDYSPVWGLLLAVAGFPVYWIWRRFRRPAATS